MEQTMTNNCGRILSDGHIGFYERTHETLDRTELIQAVKDFIATARDRDKTIAELSAEIKRIRTGSEKWTEIASSWQHEALSQKKHNTLMLSALERIANETVPRGYGAFNYRVDLIKTARDTIAQVKALTVSKQGVSVDSSVSGEQTIQESKNPSMVARQNTPNNPTEHSYQLAQHDLSKEVAADKLWRGETT
jgi:hypothetical protein